MIYLAAPPNVIDLPDDDEDVALKPRKSKKVAAGKMSQQGPTTTPPVRQPEDAGKGHPGTFDAGGALDNIKPGIGLHQPPHQPKVAPRQGLPRPQPN